MKSCFYITLLLGATCAFVTAKDVEFEVGGEVHHETVVTSEDLVVITDVYDGFIVTLDYKRKLLIIKNTISDTCFFSCLEEDHFNQDNTRPLLVLEAGQNDGSGQSQGEVDEVVFLAIEISPVGLEKLTSEVKSTEQCAGLPAYWLIEQNAGQEQLDRRGARGDTIIIIIIQK